MVASREETVCLLPGNTVLQEGFCDTGNVPLAHAWPGLEQSSHSKCGVLFSGLRANPTEVVVERLET